MKLTRSLYEDLYDLVRFIPSLNLPTGIPSPADANNAAGLPRSMYHRHSHPPSSTDPFGNKDLAASASSSGALDSIPSQASRPHLHPARDPPRFRWSECFPIAHLVSQRQRLKAEGRKARKERIKADRQGGGVGANVPLEITMFMSSWLAALQRRKTIDVPTTNALLLAVQQMGEALSALERILTTPIPWSYNAHIWAVGPAHGLNNTRLLTIQVTLIYCLLLPFQLYGSQFGWLTIPATVVSESRYLIKQH
jgi:putative membrane protein